MALVLVQEYGLGFDTANSYAAVQDGDDYHEGHLYASAWTAATAERKAAALVMATRVIDTMTRFYGVKATAAQALQWPRENCPDPNAPGDVLDNDLVPAAVLAAACELARELLLVDRTAAPPGEGIEKQHNADYSETVYSKEDTRPMLPWLVQAMLAPYGDPVAGGMGTTKLIRV
jgi:hypothetical protein